MQSGQSATTVLDVPSALAPRSENPRPSARALAGTAAAAGKFLVHFLEMALAMMVGMAIFAPVKIALVEQGYVSLQDRTSLDYQVWMNLFMIVPMVLWMRVRGCTWRDGAEMTAAMVVPPACVLLLCSLGISNLLEWFTPSLAGLAMFLGMLGIMLYRREMYATGYSLTWIRRVRSGHGHGSN